jgi:hypothetical protein
MPRNERIEVMKFTSSKNIQITKFKYSLLLRSENSQGNKNYEKNG